MPITTAVSRARAFIVTSSPSPLQRQRLRPRPLQEHFVQNPPWWKYIQCFELFHFLDTSYRNARRCRFCGFCWFRRWRCRLKPGHDCLALVVQACSGNNKSANSKHSPYREAAAVVVISCGCSDVTRTSRGCGCRRASRLCFCLLLGFSCQAVAFGQPLAACNAPGVLGGFGFWRIGSDTCRGWSGGGLFWNCLERLRSHGEYT